MMNLHEANRILIILLYAVALYLVFQSSILTPVVTGIAFLFLLGGILLARYTEHSSLKIYYEPPISPIICVGALVLIMVTIADTYLLRFSKVTHSVNSMTFLVLSATYAMIYINHNLDMGKRPHSDQTDPLNT